MDDILFFLLKKGGGKRKINITTAELGMAVRMSQQNASRRLRMLAAEGLIERKNGIAITPVGMKMIREEYESLKKAIEGDKIVLNGMIVDGLGEGRYYLSLLAYRTEIKQKLGFIPYPGTLNLKLDKRSICAKGELLKQEPIIINGFKTKKRTYGDLFAYPCRIGREGLEGAVIIPLRSNHPQNIIEVIADTNLREALGKKSGERVIIEA